MKNWLALLLLVVVVGIATCMPSESLRERLQAIRSLKGDKQRGGEKSDKGKGERDWPYGWIEFTTLVGRCETAMNWIEILDLGDLPPGDGILVEACPKAYECVGHLMNATEEETARVGKHLNDNFALLQCVNLHAQKEELALALTIAEKNIEEDMFMKETAVLSDVCNMLFENYENEAKKLKEDLDEVEAEVESREGADREERIKSLLRQLIHTTAKKR